ncbi:MAG: thioredoxin family protein [Acidimicrobiia bacterium]
MRRIVLALLLIIVACGDDAVSTTAPAAASPFPEGAFAFAASENLGVGEERLLVAVADVAGARLPSPTIPVTISVWPEGDEASAQAVAGTFTWVIPEVSGLYRATFEFDQPGTWIVRLTPDGAEPLETFPVTVHADHPVPAVGEAAPQSDTPTADDAPLAEISTDPEPDPRFYTLSIAEAVSNGRPTVIVFATPKFCQTAVCGPTLDLVKEIVADHPDVDFVHVEIYTNLDDAQNLELVPAVLEWGLTSEPWVFVVDAAGIVVARFEGVVAPEEIAAALSGS